MLTAEFGGGNANDLRDTRVLTFPDDATRRSFETERAASLATDIDDPAERLLTISEGMKWAKTGGKAVAIQCDVCDRTSINRMRDEAIAALGPIQLVFANAGATSFDPLMEMSDDDVDWILNVNLHGVMNCTRAFLPGMIASGEGHVCATASMAGLLPGWIPVHVPYSAAKAGIIGMMMNLALEMKQHNVFTTSYCPGGVATGMKQNNARYRPAKCQGFVMVKT